MRLLPALLFAVSCAVAGCAAPPPTMSAFNPYPPPPALRAESIPLPPVTEDSLIWQPGHWDWTGQGYVWRDGRYVARAGHGQQWQYGYWSRPATGWVWIPAHWV